jgi:uncharacterized RDD family membrane protein YckC
MDRAGFGLRLFASVIDLLISFFIADVIDKICLLLTAGRGAFLLSIAVSVAVLYFYFVWLGTQWDGRTLGKGMVGLRIVKTNGEPVTHGTMFLRDFVGKFLSAALAGVGFLMALGPEKRALHDWIAGTVVVRESATARHTS